MLTLAGRGNLYLRSGPANEVNTTCTTLKYHTWRSSFPEKGMHTRFGHIDHANQAFIVQKKYNQKHGNWWYIQPWEWRHSNWFSRPNLHKILKVTLPPPDAPIWLFGGMTALWLGRIIVHVCVSSFYLCVCVLHFFLFSNLSFTQHIWNV